MSSRSTFVKMLSRIFTSWRSRFVLRSRAVILDPELAKMREVEPPVTKIVRSQLPANKITHATIQRKAKIRNARG